MIGPKRCESHLLNNDHPLGLRVWEFNPSLQGIDIFSSMKNMVDPVLIFY